MTSSTSSSRATTWIGPTPTRAGHPADRPGDERDRGGFADAAAAAVGRVGRSHGAAHRAARARARRRPARRGDRGRLRRRRRHSAFTGHLLSTSTFDLLVWTAVTWLVVRAARTANDRLWPIAGAVLGMGLLNKPLPAFLALGLLAGVALAGPRRLLRNPYAWSGAAIALLLWLPWLLWQAEHDWPQIDVSRSIAQAARRARSRGGRSCRSSCC